MLDGRASLKMQHELQACGRAGMLRDLDSATGRLLPQSLQVPDYLQDLDPLDMSLFEGDLGA